MNQRSYSKPSVVDSAFKSFFDEAMEVSKLLEAENRKLKQHIYILESKLITIKIAIASFDEDMNG